MEPISDEVKRAYKRLREYQESDLVETFEQVMLDAYRHERAMRRKWEWSRAHEPFGIDDRCLECFELGLDKDEPRHNWTDKDWEVAVDEELIDNGKA